MTLTWLSFEPLILTSASFKACFQASSCELTGIFKRIKRKNPLLHCGCTTEVKGGGFMWMHVSPCGAFACFPRAVFCDLLNCNFLLNGNPNGVLQAEERMLNHNIYHLDKVVHL